MDAAVGLSVGASVGSGVGTSVGDLKEAWNLDQRCGFHFWLRPGAIRVPARRQERLELLRDAYASCEGQAFAPRSVLEDPWLDLAPADVRAPLIRLGTGRPEDRIPVPSRLELEVF